MCIERVSCVCLCVSVCVCVCLCVCVRGVEEVEEHAMSSRGRGGKSTTPRDRREKKRPAESLRDDGVTGKKRTKREASRESAYFVSEIPRWEGWKDVYFVGMEWTNYHRIFEYDWKFDHLESALVTGVLSPSELHRKDPRLSVYLFGGTEAHMLPNPDGSGESTMVVIPIVNAIVCSCEPPNQLGVKSVMMIEERVEDGSRLKLNWIPYNDDASIRAERIGKKAKLFYYACELRSAQLARLSDDQKRVYEYGNLFVQKEEEINADDFDTVVSVCEKVGGKQLVFDFDWELDDLEEFCDEIISAHELDTSLKDEIREVIRATVRARKQQIREECDRKRARWTSLPENVREGIKSMQLLKFYPQSDLFDLTPFKVSFVNRFYGKANEVF